MSEEKIQLNQIIDDFTAEATIRPFKFSDYKGKNLVIYFYPKDNTPGCTAESIDFRDHYSEFQKAGTEIVGISRDSLRSHENFARKFALDDLAEQTRCCSAQCCGKQASGAPSAGLENG